MHFRVLCICLSVIFGSVVNGSSILGLFLAPSKSHYAIGHSLFKELARRGHDVTMLCPYDEKNLPSNYKNIQVEYTLSEEDKKINFFTTSMTNPYLVTFFLNYAGNNMLNYTLNHPKVQQLLKSNKKFDAVVMDQFVDDGYSYFAHHFSANHILFSTTCANSWVNPLVGNSAPPSAVAEILMDFPSNMNFLQRVRNTLFSIFAELNRQLYFFPSQNKILTTNIPGAKPLYDYLYNVSLVLLNGHESFCDPVPLVPVMKNVGGLHVSGSGKLPEDLGKFMDDAKEGVVYFSMGSNLKSKDMPENIRNAILRVFSKLKVKILWKWEDDVLPGQPPNVNLSKWFPQQEILAHSNLKVFITHGGLLSAIEAIHHGVPLLAIPVYGDQKLNAANAAQKGYAIDLPFSQFEESKFEAALNELLTNPKYKQNALKRSEIYHSRPLKPLDEAVYWVEYTVKHRGAKHLRVASLNLNWYQYLLLDVIAFILAVLIFVLYILRLVFRKLCCKTKKDTSKKVKTN